VRSGLRAADAVLHGDAYDLANVTGASMGGGWISRMVDWGFTRGIGRPGAPLPAAT
jgi:hypothetical protein